jgi:endothelin-converting enzyme/putative endopeptidase
MDSVGSSGKARGRRPHPQTGWTLAVALLALLLSSCKAAPPKAADDPVFPYSPSLDLTSMDKSIDPCVDFYQYACGGWQKNNPIPPDQTSWSVYGKLYQDNLNYLRSLLEQAASETQRDAVATQVGDFFAACMDEAAIEKLGAEPLRPLMDPIDKLQTPADLPRLLAQLQLAYGRRILFQQGSTQDPDNSEQQIAELDQGGLGLPDRDYYIKTDAKSEEIRQKYLQHIQKMFELAGADSDSASKSAQTVMHMETALAKASMTRVDRRDPYKMKHKMKVTDLSRLAPGFDWTVYYNELKYPEFQTLNVAPPDFFREVNRHLKNEPIENWKTYLRYQVADSAAPYLSSAFVQENFDFYRKYLRGAHEQQPRWKRCVQYTDNALGEALGQIYVRKTFPAELEARTVDMVRRVEDGMGDRIRQLAWMSPETKQQALKKLTTIRNKIGHPAKWRDYSSVNVARDDFYGNVRRASEFEERRDINKVGKPVDRDEWGMTPPTVNAYYDAQMNDINFPAGVLHPPLFDSRMDDAPNYGDTGGTIGHELTHAFDDEGSQYDAAGNLKNWWTKTDRQQFDARTQCVADQYAKYVIIDDIHINSKLTLGEDVADLGGEILAYIAWKGATQDKRLAPADGLTPDQRFFVGFAQWACENDRPEDLRVRAITDPHSPARQRINGVVVNMPEFAQAFSCKPNQPMAKAADKVCSVW